MSFTLGDLLCIMQCYGIILCFRTEIRIVLSCCVRESQRRSGCLQEKTYQIQLGTVSIQRQLLERWCPGLVLVLHEPGADYSSQYLMRCLSIKDLGAGIVPSASWQPRLAMRSGR